MKRWRARHLSWLATVSTLTSWAGESFRRLECTSVSFPANAVATPQSVQPQEPAHIAARIAGCHWSAGGPGNHDQPDRPVAAPANMDVTPAIAVLASAATASRQGLLRTTKTSSGNWPRRGLVRLARAGDQTQIAKCGRTPILRALLPHLAQTWCQVWENGHFCPHLALPNVDETLIKWASVHTWQFGVLYARAGTNVIFASRRSHPLAPLGWVRAAAAPISSVRRIPSP
jgi:hypothetical protein